MTGIKMDFINVPKVSNFKLALTILGIPIALIPVWLMTKFAKNLYFWISNHTARLITPTLILYLALYFVFIFLILIKNSKLSLKEIGLEKKKLKTGVFVSILFFFLLQIYGVLYSFFAFNKLAVNEVFTQWTVVVGYYTELVLGVALFEEVVFRGFLIPQIFLRLKSNKNSRMVMTLVISQILFSIVHIPVRIVNGIDFTTLMISLAALFVVGLMFSFIYLLTENLFIAMGFHVIWDAANNSAATIYKSNYTVIIVLFFAFILMYISAVRNKKRTLRNTSEVEM